jgi:hypothetical protein
MTDAPNRPTRKANAARFRDRRAPVWLLAVLALGLWFVHPMVHAHGLPGDAHPQCALKINGATPTLVLTPCAAVAPPPVEFLSARPADPWRAPQRPASSPSSPRAPPAA